MVAIAKPILVIEIKKLLATAESVEIVPDVRQCRDPKDDKFLELAVNGRADVIVSGDKDLPALHPFRGIPILTPAAFLFWVTEGRPV